MSGRAERVLEVQVRRLAGSVLAPGDSVILTFSAGEGARKRTDPATATGPSVNLSSVVRVGFPDKAKTLHAELHLIIGENKTRIIGKGSLSLQAGLVPRMSGGRTAEETLDLRGTKDKVAVKHSLDVHLTLLEPDGEGGIGGEDGADALANVHRIRMAMKRSEQKQRLRERVDEITTKYKAVTKRRAGERNLALDLVRAYNLPELPPGATPSDGAVVRVVSGPHAMVSRVVGGTRHPPFAQTLQLKAASDVSIVLEDRGGGAAGAPAVKYCDAPLPVRDLRAGSAYLCDLKFDDGGPRLLTVVAPQWSVQEQLDKLTEDESVQHLEIEASALVETAALVARYRLLREGDEVLADWRESDEHDAELEATSIRLAAGRADDDAFNDLKEAEEEADTDGIVQHLALLNIPAVQLPNAPPPRPLGFTSRGLGGAYVLVEVFVPEVPDKDDEGREGEADDTPGMVFLAACVLELAEVAAAKETRLSKKKDAFKDPDAICYRELTVRADLRVSEDGLEALPPGTQVTRLELSPKPDPEPKPDLLGDAGDAPKLALLNPKP